MAPGRARCSPVTLCAGWWTGIGQRGVLARCDAVLSGYIGDREIGEAILDAVARVRRPTRARSIAAIR